MHGYDIKIVHWFRNSREISPAEARPGDKDKRTLSCKGSYTVFACDVCVLASQNIEVESLIKLPKQYYVTNRISIHSAKLGQHNLSLK